MGVPVGSGCGRDDYDTNITLGRASTANRPIRPGIDCHGRTVYPWRQTTPGIRPTHACPRSRGSLRCCFFALPAAAWAAAPIEPGSSNWPAHPVGLAALAIFVLAYVLVVLEERLHLRKSKPVMLAAAADLGPDRLAYAETSPAVPRGFASEAFRHVFLEFAELFFFLIVAMSFVAAIGERNVFEALRAELVSRSFSYRSLFWLTGVISFFMSAVLDNLTTALIMSGVILAVGAGNVRFITLAFINLVVAANAGGAWSAFGDITTLMVWQAQQGRVLRVLPDLRALAGELVGAGRHA